VQYNRIEDANKLIKEAQIHLSFRGNKLGRENMTGLESDIDASPFRRPTGERGTIHEHNIVVN
jgi:hypothetical protein